jgi:hypothetical protein
VKIRTGRTQTEAFTNDLTECEHFKILATRKILLKIMFPLKISQNTIGFAFCESGIDPTKQSANLN